MSLIDLFLPPHIEPQPTRKVCLADMAAPVETEEGPTPPQPAKRKRWNEVRRRQRIIERVARMKVEVARLEAEIRTWTTNEGTV